MNTHNICFHGEIDMRIPPLIISRHTIETEYYFTMNVSGSVRLSVVHPYFVSG